jgi:AcrR family transcriptional regulator
VHDDHVLDAVGRILGRDGLRGLNLSSIAEEAKLSRVTLHRRGASVDEYLIAVLGRASDDLRDSLWPVLTGVDDAATRLTRALQTLCEVFERHGGVLAALYGTPAWPIPSKPGRTTSLEFIEPFERLLLDGIADGSLVSDDPRADATLVANAVAWTYLHMRRAHGWPRQRTADRAVDLATALLRPTTSRSG